MRRITSLLAVCLLSASIAGGRAFAVDEISSTTGTNETEQERQALGEFAATLAADSDAWQVVPDAEIDEEAAKPQLHPPIPRMSCNIDRIAKFVSCYGPETSSEAEAERRFTELVGELATILREASWNGMDAAPRLDAVRSYSWQNQDSDAKIDIDIISQESPEQHISYMVTIFGWSPLAPQL